MNPRLAGDFEPELIESSRSALLELVQVLQPYAPAVVLVGGWVPWLLIRDHHRAGDEFHHVGSIDIDFVVDPEKASDPAPSSMADLITAAGWRRMATRQFAFERTVVGRDQVARNVYVDFLTTPPDDDADQWLQRDIQPGLRAKTLKGAAIALAHHTPHPLTGRLPNGESTHLKVEMLDVTGCLGMKGIALGARFKHKDAYDIVSVIDNYGDGVREVAHEVRPNASEPLLLESFRWISRKFATDRSDGPNWYAEFQQSADTEGSQLLRQRAFQLVTEFLRLLNA